MAPDGGAPGMLWAASEQALLLGWLALLAAILMLWTSRGKCLSQQLPEAALVKKSEPATRTMPVADDSPASGTDGCSSESGRPIKQPQRPCRWFGGWSTMWSCCSGRGNHGCDAGALGVEGEQRQTWQPAEVASAGVPAEVVEAIVALAELVGARHPEPLSDPLTLWRFYSAREGDVAEAAAMYRQSCAWRARFSVRGVMALHGGGEEYHPDGGRSAASDGASWEWRRGTATVEAAFVHQHGFFGRLKRPAQADGAPVAVWRLGTLDSDGFNREGLVDVLERGFVAHLEDLLQSGRAASRRRGCLVKGRLIIDMHGLTMGHCLRNRGLPKRFLGCGKAYFPEVNASVTIIRAPKVMAQVWVLVQPLLTPMMRRKVCILGDDFEAGLLAHAGLERSALPAFLGGTASNDEVCATLPVPAGAGAHLRSLAKA